MVKIAAKQLCIDFPIGKPNLSLRGTIRESVGGLLRRKEEDGDDNTYYISALSNLSFKFAAGDRVGLIGHNGAGKSTLLQTISGGYYPSSGTLDVEGRVVPLLNLGNGAVPDFSGFENIELLGLHMGMRRDEIRDKQDEIAEFTELGDYIHFPIRTYSSGMYLRLSFAIATAADPEILLVDELFGAGDKNFYHKAKERMISLMDRTGILIFANHSVHLIEQYCNKALVLDHGELKYLGNTQDAINYYNEMTDKNHEKRK